MDYRSIERKICEDFKTYVTETNEHNLEDISKSTKVKEKVKGNVLVDNSKGMMTRFAKCCLPIPGDDIVGYVSRGRGIIVHKKDCKNFAKIPNIQERYIPVIWEETKTEPKKK